MWADRIPRATIQARQLRHFTINVWAGNVGDSLVGSYLLPAGLTGAAYSDTISNTFPDLL